MRHLAWISMLLASGCQEFSIEKTIVDPGEPLDTDIAVPALFPDIQVSPPTLEFGDMPVDCPSRPITVTISNVGEGPLNIIDTTIAGPQAGAYSVVNPGSGNVRPGESVTVDVVFTPDGDRPFPNASLKVDSNDPDEPTVHVHANGLGSGNPYREDLFTQEVSSDFVDVLFIVDTSQSMEDNVNALLNAMDSFIQQFLVLGLDYRIGVTTTDMTATGARGSLLGPVVSNFTLDPVGDFRRLVNQGFGGSNHEVGFDAASAALSMPLIGQPPNNGLLRPDANLAVVVISDEDDSNAYLAPRLTQDFINFMLSLKADPGDVSFSGLVGPATGGLLTNACGGIFASNQAQPAPQYHRAINATGGAWGNICTLNIVPFLEQLSLVVAGLDSRFTLSATPSDTTCGELEVEVAGVLVPCDQYTYYPATNEIELNEGWVPDEGEGVIVSYPIGDGCP